jgi:hypothetical protein
MDANEVLVARLRRREGSVDLGDGKKVVFRRPTEVELSDLLTTEGDKATWSVGIDHVRKYVIGWEGFTAADFLGADIAAADPVPWSQALWNEICSDDIVLTGKVAKAILDSVVAFIGKRESVAKNSEPA